MSEKQVKVMTKLMPSNHCNILVKGTINEKQLYDGTTFVDIYLESGVLVTRSRNDIHIIGDTLEEDMRPKAVVFDIDGVLNYIDGGEVVCEDGEKVHWTNLRETAKACIVPEAEQMLQRYEAEGYEIIFLTARGETQRAATKQFLDCFMIGDYSLYMRGFGCNNIHAHDLKAQMMQACIMPFYQVECFYDDSAANVGAVREVCPELMCYQVHI